MGVWTENVVWERDAAGGCAHSWNKSLTGHTNRESVVDSLAYIEFKKQVSWSLLLSREK